MIKNYVLKKDGKYVKKLTNRPAGRKKKKKERKYPAAELM